MFDHLTDGRFDTTSAKGLPLTHCVTVETTAKGTP